jgi:hypothetical protein
VRVAATEPIEEITVPYAARNVSEFVIDVVSR